MSRFPLSRAAVTGVATAAAFAAVLSGAGSASAAAWPDGAWTGSGTATTTVTSDGSATDPVFDYASRGYAGNWTFQATAKTARTQPVAYHYKGYHAWSRVTVGLQQFVIHNGQETDTPLQSAGPVSCCAAPSGGFDYTGTANFVLQPGDVYGFKMSGGNFDSDNRLLGTLSLSVPAAPVAITNPGTQTGTVGTASSVKLTSNGGVAPITWSATGLPAGLSINSSTGAISGTPTTSGTFAVTVTATDAAAPTHTTASQTFSWKINPSSGCAGEKVVNGGFESGNAPWNATAGALGNSGPDQTPHSGARYAWLAGYGTTHTDQVSQTVTIPAGCTNYTFSFYLHIDTAETSTTTQFDKLTVELGATKLMTFSNLNHANGYVQRSVNISSLAGTTATLKFTGSEDASLQTSFIIDDVSVAVS